MLCLSTVTEVCIKSLTLNNYYWSHDISLIDTGREDTGIMDKGFFRNLGVVMFRQVQPQLLNKRRGIFLCCFYVDYHKRRTQKNNRHKRRKKNNYPILSSQKIKIREILINPIQHVPFWPPSCTYVLLTWGRSHKHLHEASKQLELVYTSKLISKALKNNNSFSWGFTGDKRTLYGRSAPLPVFMLLVRGLICTPSTSRICISAPRFGVGWCDLCQWDVRRQDLSRDLTCV